MFQRVDGTAQFGHTRGSLGAHRCKRFCVCRVTREIDQLIGVGLQVMEELVVVVEVTHVFETVIADTFIRGYAVAHRKVLVESFGAPIGRRLCLYHRANTAALIARRHFRTGPVQEGGRQVEIERHGIGDLAPLRCRQPGIGDDKGHTDTFFIVRPLARQAPIGHVIAIISGVDDDGVIRQARRFQGFHEAPKGGVDTTHHAVIRLHVELVFHIRVPAPEIAFPRDTRLKEIGQGLKDGRILQTGWGHGQAVVHPVGTLGPGKLANAGTTVTVFRVAGVEPQIKGERLALGLVLHKLDALVDDEVSLMTEAAVWHLLVKGITANDLDFVEVLFPFEALGHAGVPLAKVSRAIALFPEDIGVERFHGVGTGLVRVVGRAKAPAGESRKNRRAAHPADGVAHEGVGKAHALLGQLVEVGRLHHVVAITADGAGGLVIGEEEDDIRRGRSAGELGKGHDDEKTNSGDSHRDDAFCFFGVE